MNGINQNLAFRNSANLGICFFLGHWLKNMPLLNYTSQKKIGHLATWLDPEATVYLMAQAFCRPLVNVLASLRNSLSCYIGFGVGGVPLAARLGTFCTLRH